MSSCSQHYALPRVATVGATSESIGRTWNLIHRAGHGGPETGPCGRLMSEVRSTVELMNQADLAQTVSSR